MYSIRLIVWMIEETVSTNKRKLIVEHVTELGDEMNKAMNSIADVTVAKNLSFQSHYSHH